MNAELLKQHSKLLSTFVSFTVLETQASKHAVDTVVDFANSVNPDINIEQVMPTGFSKVRNRYFIVLLTSLRLYEKVIGLANPRLAT